MFILFVYCMMCHMYSVYTFIHIKPQLMHLSYMPSVAYSGKWLYHHVCCDNVVPYICIVHPCMLCYRP